MPQMIREVMTPNPVTITAGSTVIDAARAMRESDVGDVIVLDGGRMCGIVTDRDITIRAVAEGRDPREVKAEEICSKDVTTVTPDDQVDQAVRLMREKAIRRLPVIEGTKPVGIVSLGDLALEKDPNSALADISAAPPNK